jgi:hypothetical protein
MPNQRRQANLDFKPCPTLVREGFLGDEKITKRGEENMLRQ